MRKSLFLCGLVVALALASWAAVPVTAEPPVLDPEIGPETQCCANLVAQSCWNESEVVSCYWPTGYGNGYCRCSGGSWGCVSSVPIPNPPPAC